MTWSWDISVCVYIMWIFCLFMLVCLSMFKCVSIYVYVKVIVSEN